MKKNIWIVLIVFLLLSCGSNGSNDTQIDARTWGESEAIGNPLGRISYKNIVFTPVNKAFVVWDQPD